MKINLSINIVRLIFEACKRQWESDSIRNLIALSNGKSMTKNMMTIDGDYPVYGANGIIGKTDKYLVEQPTITVGRVGSCGEINLTTGAAWISDNAMWVNSIKEGIDYSFMYYGLRSLDLSSGAKIAAMPSISQENVYRETLPIPPIEEQKIIVQYLDQSKKGVSPENRISLPESIKAIEETIGRVEALASRIVKAQSLREDASEEVDFFLKSCVSNIFDYKHGDEIPNGWKWKSFNEILEKDGMRTGPFGTLLNKSEIYDEGVPVFGIQNVGNSVFRPGFTDYVTTEKAKALSVYVLEEGDIAIARSGTVGRSCIVPKLDPKPIMSSNLIRIRINKKVFLPDLMCQILTGSKLVERHIDKECRGSTRIFFTQKILNKFQIPVPPLDEQRRIVAYLDSVQARLASLRELQSQTQEELDALLPSVLDRAFKGEL